MSTSRSVRNAAMSERIARQVPAATAGKSSGGSVRASSSRTGTTATEGDLPWPGRARCPLL